MTHVVMNVNNLRLGSLYTDDPSKTRWWAEVVLIECSVGRFISLEL